MKSFPLFLMIVMFAGSTVFVAGRDIRAHLTPPTQEDKARVEHLLKDLRGELAIPAHKAGLAKEQLPVRKTGSYLSKNDIDRIKKFLSNLIQSDEPQEGK
jgi:hypothetical protein